MAILLVAALIVNFPLVASKSGLPQAIRLAFIVIFSLTFIAEASPQLEGAMDSLLITPSSTFVGNVASLTATSQSSFEYQNALTEAISYKEAQVSGIDLDEELSQMIIFQQSYAACAQVFTASREILDILLGLV